MMGSSSTGCAFSAAALKPMRAGDLERHVARVDGVVLAVVEHDAHVDHRVAGEEAFGHGVADALLDGGDEVARDDAADDLVDELEALAARLRLHLDPGVGELAAAAGLLLVLPCGLGACP